MKIAVASSFRNSARKGHLARYFRRLRALERLLHSPLTWIAAEGDSTDQTPRLLADEMNALPLRRSILLNVSHRGPEYGSTEEPERLLALSRLFNQTLEAVPPKIDVLVWVESDLLWEPEVLARLATTVWLRPEVDVIAPLTFAGAAQYDTWGCRLLGPGDRRLPPAAPYFPNEYLAQYGDPGSELVEMASVGSCFAIRGTVARKVRVQDGQAIVGWCAAARAQGHRVWLAPALAVDHPHAGMPVEAQL